MRDLQKDLELCEKATEGPWEIMVRDGVIIIPGIVSGANGYSGYYDPPEKEDAEFIAAAREGWPYAIERALKAEELLRDILPMAMWESCRYREHAEADPTTHCCDWNEIAERIREVSTEEVPDHA